MSAEEHESSPHIGSSPLRFEALFTEIIRRHDRRTEMDATLAGQLERGEVTIDPLALAMFESDRAPLDDISWIRLSPQRQGGYVRRAQVARAFIAAESPRAPAPGAPPVA